MTTGNGSRKAREAERDAKVLELRRAGLGFDTIAKQLRFRDAAGAHAAYERALAEAVPLTIDDRRRLELERLERLQTPLWPKAMKGDLAAVAELGRLARERMAISRTDPLPQDVDRKPGPIEAATREECERLAKNAPALAAAALTLARCVDDAGGDAGATATAARELRMTMSQLRGLAGYAPAAQRPAPADGEDPDGGGGTKGKVVPETKLDELRRRAQERQERG
ncbi:hypothetical protein ACOACO_17510 [Nocardioides sp. CPCC 205120]|uniref:hypothetical protein n=1 Tax=Nocardioides sp. CPCC 205120 TaxID=3406462 RepID=UPI003B509759